MQENCARENEIVRAFYEEKAKEDRAALFAVSTGASSRLMAALTKIGWPKVTRFLFVPVEIPW